MRLLFAVLALLAFLPAIMSFLFRVVAVNRRKSLIIEDLKAYNALDTPLVQKRGGTTGIVQEMESIYSYRFWTPALVLSLLYLFLFVVCEGYVAEHFNLNFYNLFSLKLLDEARPLLAAFLGAYVFNLGSLLRRVYLSDLNATVFWSAINRLVLSVGLATILAGSFGRQRDFLYFMVAFVPSIFIDWMLEKVTKTLGSNKLASPDLRLQAIQGIDTWKEYRLQEESIEDVQNLATADVISLALRTHYPLRTLVDWIDQAILISRIGDKVTKLWNSGLGVSAVEFAWLSPHNNGGRTDGAQIVAPLLAMPQGLVEELMNSLAQDEYVQTLWILWQRQQVTPRQAGVGAPAAAQLVERF